MWVNYRCILQVKFYEIDLITWNVLIILMTVNKCFTCVCLQEKSHLLVTHVICGSFSVIIWTDTRGCTAERSHTSVIAAIRLLIHCFPIADILYIRAARYQENLCYAIMLLNIAMMIWVVIIEQILKFTVLMSFSIKFVMLTDTRQRIAFSVSV